MTALPEPLEALPEAGAAGEPGADAATRRLTALGCEQPYAWSNGPGDTYAAHDHAYTKLLVCAEGSITFLVGVESIAVELEAGDGFVLPPGTRHAAVVGPRGCTCVEGHRR